MRRTSCTAVALISGLVTIGLAATANAGWDKKREKQTDASLNNLVSQATPSVAACIAMDGEPVYKKAFGMAAPGVPATPTTIYRIGSLSKQFTAAAILALIEDGGKVPKDGSKFALSDNVSLFFDGVDGWSKPGSPMTVQRLANMTSNLPDYTQTALPGLDPAQPVKESDLFKALLTLKPTSTAIAYTYSSTNYFLLAKIIEQVQGSIPVRMTVGHPVLKFKADYRDYIRRRIFARAKLTATNFIDDPQPLGQAAAPTLPPTPYYANMSWPKGAGAIQSNVADLCTWDAALIGGSVLTAASAATMGTPGSPYDNGSPPTTYAMGWSVSKYQVNLEYWHNGFIPGFSATSTVVYYGQHYIAVVILTNGDKNFALLGTARNIVQSVINPP